ncbi:hypothetical protein BASA81_008666 [Batrachochytrium salamandrivorans]|nr:hypothetical protein BASA81_008666 [Batrachochytrium salamandrivorans]
MNELHAEVAQLKRKLRDVTEMYRASQAIVLRYEGMFSRPAPISPPSPPSPPPQEVVECSLFIPAGEEDEDNEEQAVENSQDSFLRYVNPVVEEVAYEQEEEEEWVSQDLLGLPPTQISLPLPPAPSSPIPAPSSPHRQTKYTSVVRGKARQSLPGHACEECVKFFESIKNTLHPGEDMQTVMNRYSRHRHEHKPPPTPPGYWSVWSLGEDEEDAPCSKRVKL